MLTSSPSLLPGASFWRRLMAMVYDVFLVGAILLAVTAINLGIFNAIHGTGEIKSDPFHTLGPWHVPSLWLAVYGFYVGFWVKSGQTLGMQAWRIQVQGPQGQRVTWGNASLRFLAAHLSLACAGLGLFWSLVDKDKQTWHDRMTSTRTVVLPKQR